MQAAHEHNGSEHGGTMMERGMPTARRARSAHARRSPRQRSIAEAETQRGSAASPEDVFLYPPPDRMRPSELAERASMTKQAMNYLLGQLEARGYIERRAEKGSSRRLVFLTNRGWQVRDNSGGSHRG